MCSWKMEMSGVRGRRINTVLEPSKSFILLRSCRERRKQQCAEASGKNTSKYGSQTEETFPARAAKSPPQIQLGYSSNDDYIVQSTQKLIVQ